MSETVNPAAEARVTAEQERIQAALNMMERRVVGQRPILERLLMGLILQGHVLLEGLPGLAKTTAVKTLGDTASLSVSRIQFTPDLLPADLIGTQIYDPRSAEFRVKKGPIFANLVIADEINRAPAKVQSALLEAMQERQITIGEQSFHLEEPFLVMATQNPIEQEGTYPLPEAQMDRFLFKIKVGYSNRGEEIEIVRRMAGGETIPLEQLLTRDDILRLRSVVHDIFVSEKIRQYIVDLVFASREPDKNGLAEMKSLIHYGASPRASINLERAARAAALFDGRHYVVPQDVKDVALDVLRHRILLTYEAEAENVTTDDVVRRILQSVDVP